MYAVHCRNEAGADSFWRSLAARTSGCYVRLDDFADILRMIMAICYREQGPVSLQVNIETSMIW